LGATNVSAPPPARIYTVDATVRHVILYYHLFKNSGSSMSVHAR